MGRFNERYVVDENGNKVNVIIDIGLYQKLLEELEELEPIGPTMPPKQRKRLMTLMGR